MSKSTNKTSINQVLDEEEKSNLKLNAKNSELEEKKKALIRKKQEELNNVSNANLREEISELISGAESNINKAKEEIKFNLNKDLDNLNKISDQTKKETKTFILSKLS